MNGYLNGMGYGMDTGVTLLPVLIVSIICFIIGVIFLIANIRIFTKAGKKGWLALIPIYNIIVLMDIAKLSYKNLLLLLIPIVGMIIFIVKLYIGLAKTFGKGIGFALGLLFLPIIFIPILGFSKDKANEINSDNVDVNNQDNNINTTTNNNVNDIQTINNIQEIDSLQENNINSDYDVINDINNIVSNDDNLNTINNTLESFNNINQVDNLEENVSPLNNIESLNNPVLDKVSSSFEELDINQITNNTVNEVNIVNSTNNENSSVNAFNQVPVMETYQDNSSKIETFNIESDVEVLNEVNNQNNEFLNMVNNDSNLVNLNSMNHKSSGKFCKNCGTEMPKIVTICPSCGTDNE